MTATTVTKKDNERSQKYDGGAPPGGIAAMIVAMVLERQNYKFELIIRTNEGEIIPPSGDIAEMVASAALK